MRDKGERITKELPSLAWILSPAATGEKMFQLSSVASDQRPTGIKDRYKENQIRPKSTFPLGMIQMCSGDLAIKKKKKKKKVFQVRK